MPGLDPAALRVDSIARFLRAGIACVLQLPQELVFINSTVAVDGSVQFFNETSSGNQLASACLLLDATGASEPARRMLHGLLRGDGSPAARSLAALRDVLRVTPAWRPQLREGVHLHPMPATFDPAAVRPGAAMWFTDPPARLVEAGAVTELLDEEAGGAPRRRRRLQDLASGADVTSTQVVMHVAVTQGLTQLLPGAGGLSSGAVINAQSDLSVQIVHSLLESQAAEFLDASTPMNDALSTAGYFTATQPFGMGALSQISGRSQLSVVVPSVTPTRTRAAFGGLSPSSSRTRTKTRTKTRSKTRTPSKRSQSKTPTRSPKGRKL